MKIDKQAVQQRLDLAQKRYVACVREGDPFGYYWQGQVAICDDLLTGLYR